MPMCLSMCSRKCAHVDGAHMGLSSKPTHQSRLKANFLLNFKLTDCKEENFVFLSSDSCQGGREESVYVQPTTNVMCDVSLSSCVVLLFL